MAKYISERDKRVKEREHLYRQAGLLTSADGKSERARVVEEQSKQYADAIMPPKPLTPAERYAQSRINNTSSDRRLNAMEQRLDPGTNVRTTYGAKREWEKDTDAVISARDKVNNQPVTAAMTGGDNPWAGLFSSNTRQNTTNYAKVAEEYRKKYGIESEDEFNNALEYRAAENAQRQAEHKEAKKKVPYTKYENLSDDDKALVARTYGDGTGHANDYTNWRNPNLKAVPLTRSEAKEKLREKYTDEEIKELRKGYRDSSKYGTPITEDKELATKYAYLDGRAKELIANIPIDTANEVEDLFVEATRKELRDNYNLTDDEITQLSVYARRKSDANTGNKEFWSEAGKEAAKDDKALASVASIGSNMVSNVTSPLGILRDVAENRALKNAGYKGDTTLNKDNPLYAMRNYTQGIRGQRAEDLNEAWGTDKVAGFIYQTAMSGADSLMAMSIGSLFPAVNFGGTINGVKNTISLGAAATNAAYSMGMGGLMLGMGAGVDTMLDLTDKGASAETAVMGGLVSGTFEMLFEDLSISELSTFKGIEAMNMAKGWTKQAVKQNVKIAAEKILGSAVTNASEEGLTEIANLIYDTLANGDMSQCAEYYNNAIASGMSTDEARKEAFKDMALQVLEAAAGGALMGVGFGVGGAVKLNAQRNTTYAMSPDGLVPVTPKMKGRAISASGRVGETLQAADVVGGTAQEYKDQLVDKAGGSSNLTDKQIGKIALETQFATEGNEEKRKALKSFREEAEVKRANYKQGTTENGNKTRYLITNSPITVDGKETTINGNNKVDTEGEVFTDGKNGLEFKTGDGRTVELTRQTASQIKNEDARNLALFAVNNSLKAKSANLLFNTYDGEFLASDHASAFLNIYRQGSLGTKNKALIKNYSESLSKFTADQVNEIMNAGLEEKKFTPGATDFRVSEKKNNFVNLQVKIMDSIAKALNKELIVTDDLFDEYTREDGTKGYRALNGTYIKGDNRIILSAKADNGLLLSFLAHEMGHEMKNIDSDAFGRLEKVVKSYYTPEEFEEMKAEFVLKGYKESEAEEEIIANALFKVWDKDTIKKVIGKNKSLAVKLYNLVDKISKTYDKAIQRFTTGTDRYGNERNADVKKLLDNKQFMDDVKEVFTEYIGNMQSGKYNTTAEGGLNAIANTAEKEVVKEFGDNLGEVITDGEGDLVLATDKNEETAMYSYSTWQDRGRDELIGLLKAKGHTATEIKDVISQIEDAADYLKILAAGDAKNAGYDALADHLIADVVTDVANGKQIVSALVPNGDYPVNIDLALICKKRVAYMKLLNYLVGEGVLEDVKFGGEAIADVNKILRDSGFETACLGCFVESRRLQIQTWAETIAQEWNAAVDKVRKNAPYFNFSDKEGAANLTDDEINDLESWLNKQTKNDKGNVKAPGKTPTTKAGNLLKMLQKTGEGEAFNALAKKITVGDLITPQGLTKLRSVSGELFSFVKSRYGAASPKIVQDFNPYNSEIAMMTFEAVKKITGKSISGSQSYLSAAKEELADSKPPKKDKAGTEKWNADVQNLALQKYFKDIGGIRIQSFSDFMIENVFDYLQIVADLSARDFTMHGYTKEASAIRLFGMTGIKWNGSLIAHVDPKMGKEFAGLMPASEAKAHRGILVKVDGKEYSIGFDDFERHSKFDKNSFIQSIGYKDMVALQCDKRYSPYVGSICIGVSDKQIEAMLDSDLIRMIIPYHASGMLPEFANLIGVDMYTDYTNYQNTRIEKLFDVNGKTVTELVIGKDKKGKDKYAGNKQVGHFEWNAKVQELGDAKAAAKAYIEWCHEQHPVFNKKGDLIGYATYEPKFSQFSNHENYYKLLEDFNSYDSVTGVSAVQDAVKMNLPSKDNKLTAKELAEYKQALKKTGLFSDSEIEKYAKKAQMSFQDIIKESVDERIAYNKMTEPIKQETFEKVKNLLLEKYNREGNRAASIEDYLNAQKNPKTKSTLQPLEGAYGDNGVKYSYRDLDSEYEEAYFDGDDERMQSIIDEAAVDAGYKYKAYHHTMNSFTKFDLNRARKTSDIQGFYFSADPEAESEFGNARYDVYLRMRNPYIVDSAEKAKAIPFDLSKDNSGVEARQWLLDNGYDSVIRKAEYYGAEADEYIVLDANQIKSAEPTTYEDDEIIYPSQRFDDSDDDIRYSYAGNRAETADKDLLAEAEQMEKSGSDSETIRQKTGWFRGYDNKWRFEIDDSKATWNNEAKLKTDVFDTGYDYIKLTDLMDHPELYKAYPELKDVKVYIRPSQATSGMVYGGSTSSIFMRKFDPSSQLWRDFVTHELQHVVQNIEEFATGASQNQYRQLDWGEKEYAAVDKRNEIADKLYAVLRRNGVSISNEAIEDNKYAWTDGFVSSIINDNYFKLQSLAERNPRTKSLVDEYYEQVGTLNATTPFGQYMNTAGEIEANDVMSRRRLSADERKNRRPDIDNPNAILKGVDAAKYSYSDRNLDGYEGYDDDITIEDIKTIQRIAKEKNKPSIKEFNDDDIKATRKWAYRFRHLKEKSPFFRAWFGEWRALDEAEVTTSHSDKNIAPTNGREYNRDTEQYISWGKQLRGETRIKYGLDSDEYHFVRNIDKIIKNAVLLDTRLSFTDSNSKMKNTEFFHWFYAVCDDKNGNPCVVRLSVEQAFNNQMTDEFVRGYEVHQIKKVAELHLSVLAENSGLTQQSTTITNVAQLYDFVKKNEKKFVPGKEVSKKLFDKDTNKPKVFYHGTASDFDTFNMSEGAYGKGAYFTTSTAEAADYAIEQLEAKGIEVPEDYDDIEDWLFENGYIREYYLNVPEDQIFSSKYGSDELVAMITDPSQAKSATDNIGTYNRFNSNTKLSLSERGDIDEYEAEQLLDTAKGEDAKAIVDAVDRELLGDAMYYGRKAEQLRDEKNAAKKEAKSLNSKVETRNRQIAALRQKVKDQKLADDIYYQRRIHEIREDRDQKILALKAARRQQDINRRENKLVRDYRSRIQRVYDNLSKELLKPNANRYVPKDLVNTVAAVLSGMSDVLQTTEYYTEGSREGQEIKSHVENNKRLADLKVAYDSLKDNEKYSQVYDPVITDMLQDISETIGSKTIEKMNAKELEQVYTVLKAIDHTVRKAAKVEIAGREADAFKLADKSIDQLKEVKKKKINAISKFWYEQLNPRSFFRQLAGYTDGGWMDTYEILNNGQLQQTAIKSEITEAFRELTGDKRARELMDTDKLVDVGLRDAYGKPIPITRGMMISLYMHLQNEDNTRHIERGGLTVPDIELYYKGNSEAFGNNIARSAGASAELRYLNHQLSELREKRKTAENTMALDAQIEELEERYNFALEKADILSENLKLNIERELTDYDRAWIAKAKWLFDEYSKGKLNEATMRMYGFRKANVENYMPIRTDETDRAPTFEGVKRDVSLENSGFMKDRQKGASNAIYLEDIVDVIKRQMDNVATYSGLAPAVKDFEKIYGKSKVNQDNEVLTTSSVQGAVRDTFGKYGMKYVHDLVTDLQGGRRKEPSIISTLRGNAYQAALTLNLRVAMAQAGSYPTAAAEIGWKPLMQALAKGGEKGKPLSKADRELIAKYTPLLANRINGGHNTVAMGDSGNRSAVDINNLKLMSSKSAKGLNARILNKTAVLTDWIAKVDAATVGRLWYACQYYVDAQSPNLEKGSDEYYQEVAKVFNRVVERTQPSYTTMQRSALLRNPNEAMKLFTMYMTQRAQNFNLVYDSAMEYHTLRQSGASEEKLKESRSKLGRVVSSQLAAGLTLSAMKIVADAIQHSMKGYRDDDDEVTLAKILEKLGLTWLESELSNIFLASEIYSAVSKAITGETYYGISVNVTGALTDLTKSLVTMAQNPSPSTIDKAFRNAATILGIPSSQMKKFADMGIYWFEDIKDGGGIYSYSENGSSVKTETTKMVKQFLNGDMESYRKTREGLNGENASTVKSHIVTYLREQYVEDKLTDYEVRRVLESVYGMSSSNIDKKLEEFRQRKNGTYEKKESKKWGEE